MKKNENVKLFWSVSSDQAHSVYSVFTKIAVALVLYVRLADVSNNTFYSIGTFVSFQDL